MAAGASVLTSIQASNMLKKKNIIIDLFDLRSLTAIKMNKIFDSVQKTQRILLIEDGWSKGGYASEIITMILEKGIKLKSKPKRICWPNSHVPMSKPLEDNFYFTAKDIFKACITLAAEK